MTSYAFADLITFTRASAATYVNSSGNIATAASGSPRFDYDPVTLAPRGLLVEEQRTNLLTYSEQFDNAAWQKVNASVTANAGVAPDGTTTADKLVESVGVTRGRVMQLLSTAVGNTISVYAKAAEWNRVSIGITNGSGVWGVVTFNLANGTVDGGVSYGGEAVDTPVITSVGNGWYRCSVRVAAGTSYPVIMPFNQSGDPVFPSPALTGDGTSGIFVWGAQLEVGSFASSYIPTVASQVTRAAEVPVIQSPNFAPWYNSTEGTFVIEYSLLSATYATTKHVLTFSDGTGNNRISVYNTATTATPFLLVADGGVTQASAANAAIGSNVVAKTGVGYKVNDFALITNGGTAATDTSGTVPAAVNRVYIAGSATGAQPINGHIRTVRYYASRLTNAQLQALTV